MHSVHGVCKKTSLDVMLERKIDRELRQACEAYAAQLKPILTPKPLMLEVALTSSAKLRNPKPDYSLCQSTSVHSTCE